MPEGRTTLVKEQDCLQSCVSQFSQFRNPSPPDNARCAQREGPPGAAAVQLRSLPRALVLGRYRLCRVIGFLQSLPLSLLML